jgi:arylsulfatase A-like enzyme
MQGRSLLPLVAHGHPADWRTEFFYEHHYAPKIIPPSEGVRTERWAYIRWLNEKPLVEELCDLRSDILETHNLAADPQHAATLQQLRARREKFRAELQ